jgi:hypothetical protein
VCVKSFHCIYDGYSTSKIIKWQSSCPMNHNMQHNRKTVKSIWMVNFQLNEVNYGPSITVRCQCFELGQSLLVCFFCQILTTTQSNPKHKHELKWNPVFSQHARFLFGRRKKKLSLGFCCGRIVGTEHRIQKLASNPIILSKMQANRIADKILTTSFWLKARNVSRYRKSGHIV